LVVDDGGILIYWNASQLNLFIMLPCKFKARERILSSASPASPAPHRARSGGGKAKSDGKVAVGGTERKKAPPIPFSFTRVGIPPLLIFILI
jgi:hypothetical protein